jgi:predicted DNA-binding transcriptional regulator YafY
LLKVIAALPGDHREDERRVRQRLFIDSVGWERSTESAPHLHTIYQAVWQDRLLAITYRIGPLATSLEQLVEPHGLVAKAGIWYLVYRRGEAVRVIPVSRLLDVRMVEEPFLRPADFDLAAFWHGWCIEQDKSRSFFVVTLRMTPLLLPELPYLFSAGPRRPLAQPGITDPSGWITLELAFESLEAARDRLLALGASVEVLAPRALRTSLADYARQVAAIYARQPE